MILRMENNKFTSKEEHNCSDESTNWREKWFENNSALEAAQDSWSSAPRVTLEIHGIWPCTRDWPRTGRQPVKRMCSYVLPATCVLDSVSLHTCVRIHAKSRIWNTVVYCQDYQKRRFRPSAYLNWHAVTPWVGQCMEILLIKYQTWLLLLQIKSFSCFSV